MTTILNRKHGFPVRKREIFLRKPLLRCYYVPPRVIVPGPPAISEECYQEVDGCPGFFEWDGIECRCDCHYTLPDGRPAYIHGEGWQR